MKTKTLLLLPILLALVTLPFLASARMGETEDQSQTRYGVPVTPELDRVSPYVNGMISHTYQYQGWHIRAAFLNGQTVKIGYSRIATPDTSPQLTAEEIAAILASEAGTDQWKEIDKKTPNPTVASKRWIHPNGNTAFLQNGGLSLYIESPAVAKFKADKKAEAETARKTTIPKF